MIRVIVGEADRRFPDFRSIEEGWLARMIQGRKEDGRTPCIRVEVNHDGLNVTLISGACDSTSGGGGREPNRREARAFELWDEKGLNGTSIKPGDLISFLKQLRRLT